MDYLRTANQNFGNPQGIRKLVQRKLNLCNPAIHPEMLGGYIYKVPIRQMSGGIRLDIYLENKLLLMSINCSPKTRYTYLKEQHTVCFPGRDHVSKVVRI